ncbi:hypothetical protein J6590_026741 [Homalodisca vitripennis]|nr:hypothetical protein J6590_026741 [Homalodisca vitripennis]
MKVLLSDTDIQFLRTAVRNWLRNWRAQGTVYTLPSEALAKVLANNCPELVTKPALHRGLFAFDGFANRSSSNSSR